ncbi:hypothetical protein TNCV_650261 [Trichonephila clavipes]|nr:hypothetical protein TNCV_650261 [Trichonephila clavipes]
MKEGRFVLGTFRSERMRVLYRSRQDDRLHVMLVLVHIDITPPQSVKNQPTVNHAFTHQTLVASEIKKKQEMSADSPDQSRTEQDLIGKEGQNRPQRTRPDITEQTTKNRTRQNRTEPELIGTEGTEQTKKN